MPRFIQDGKVIDYKNTGENPIIYNDAVVFGTKVFVAAETIKPGETGGLYTDGVFEFECASTIELGTTVYYDPSTKKVTSTKGELTAIAGIVVNSISSTVVNVKIG